MSSLFDRFSGPTWQWLFRSIFPPVLFVITAASALVKGMAMFGGGAESRLGALAQSAMFAVPLMLAMGAHAFGHYLAACYHGVKVYPPYFLPAASMSGINGAYTKLTWPIEDRRTLVRIFTAGPIAGFIFSVVLLAVGFPLSTATPHIDSNNIVLGESLLMKGFGYIVFPGMGDNIDIMLHPIAFAGWIGLNFNVWQLFPVGRFDGGRLIYALWGYRRTVIISWITIAVLLALGFAWTGWVYLALFAALTMIRLKRQYPIEKHEGELDLPTECLIWAVLIIFVLIFTHSPAKLLS